MGRLFKIYTETEGYLSVPNFFAYTDSNWKDKLTSYDGKDITYDNIGNPTKYNGWTFTWEQGRQLSGMSKSGMDVSFKYNDSGIRTQKTVNGVTTNYYLDGDKVTYEDNGTDKIYYTYDASGNLVSMNLNGVEYYYIRNGQGDIIGLFDKSGTAVASYTYDSWGKLISIKDGSGADITNNTDSVGYKNQYRYRGYRYDSETGLYCVGTRYYDPQTGRFINADTTDTLTATMNDVTDKNLFAYCDNNPVMRVDHDGEFWQLALAGGGKASFWGSWGNINISETWYYYTCWLGYYWNYHSNCSCRSWHILLFRTHKRCKTQHKR